MAAERSPEGRAAWVLSQLYYYAAAVVGVGLLIGGGIAALMGVRTLVLPEEFEQARDGVRGLLIGLCFVLAGAALLWWHLREARRREHAPTTAAFWGTSLYFHLVALVALAFVLIGTIGILISAVDAAVPRCFGGEVVPAEPGGVTVEEAPHGSATFSECYPTGEDAGRQALNFGIVLLVGGPVYWWHLRQGRRIFGAAPPAPS